MKKVAFFLLFTIYYLLFSPFGENKLSLFTIDSYAVVATPSSEAEDKQGVFNDQVSDLKERIASRVAQLKLVEKRGVIGTVTDVSDTQITLSDLANNTRFVDVDELTKFASPSAKETFGISDIAKGNTIGVLGLYNKQSRRLLARFIEALKMPKVIHGAVAALDAQNFAIEVASDKETITVDVENITKTQSYTKDSGLVRSGFSRIKENERIMVVGFPDIKDKNRLIASRIIHFTDIPKNPKLSAKPAPQEKEPVVSTGSGIKLTPITR
ncbi:MAG: hypothetical protein HYY87_01570 [Candidatus Levybacteria bacterium]|nr:hypothetical protein [Candidatus Levybacteria bacterium]MBI3069978.1 hypothetical protein [Candidatus Levybacteria bacterium]